MNVDHCRRLPLRKQVENEVRQWIELGKFDPGSQLPPAREIAVLCGDIKEQTVRRALKTLMLEGLIEGAQGKGVFVAQNSTRHKRVALVLPNFEDELTIQIASGARQVLTRNGLQLLILDAHRDSSKEQSNIATLEDLPVDGAVIFPVAYHDIAEWILRLKMNRFPAVLVDNYFPGIALDCVLADDYGGAYRLTSTLIERGYRRIAWMGTSEISTAKDRFEGYRWALGDHGIAVSRDLVRPLHMPDPTTASREYVHRAVNGLLDLPEHPQAIFCENDLVAIEAIEYLAAKGVPVPAEIAVSGFDDLRAAREFTPAITTVRKPMDKMGALAAERLLLRLASPNLPRERIVTPTEVIVRQSA